MCVFAFFTGNNVVSWQPAGRLTFDRKWCIFILLLSTRRAAPRCLAAMVPYGRLVKATAFTFTEFFPFTCPPFQFSSFSDSFSSLSPFLLNLFSFRFFLNLLSFLFRQSLITQRHHFVLSRPVSSHCFSLYYPESLSSSFCPRCLCCLPFKLEQE